MNADEPALGDRIREARLQAGLTICQLAKLARCSRNFLAAVERGMLPSPRARSRASIENVLHVLAVQLESESPANAISSEKAHA